MNRKTIRSSAREVIYKVYVRCLAELEAGQILSVNDVYKRTAEMTGKSVSTIRRIAKEGQTNKGVFSTPGKHRTGRPKKELDDFDLCAIRQKVQSWYTVKKIAPTLRNLLPVVREDIGFDGSREHLRKVLKALGFRYKKCQSGKQAWMERQNIAAKRDKTVINLQGNSNSSSTETDMNDEFSGVEYLDEDMLDSD